MSPDGEILTHYICADKSHTPAYMNRNGINYKLVTNQQGSVRFVMLSTTGVVQQEMNYDEFGNVTVDTNPGFQPFGFAGGIYDLNTKLTRYGARDYDAEVGRWTAKDPILFEGGDTNLYSYVIQDPVNFVDPDGLISRQEQAPGNVGGGGYPAADIGGPAGSSGGGISRGISIKSYTKHGINRSIGDGQGRAGVCPKAIKETLNNPIDIIIQKDGWLRFEGPNATIIINNSGRVRSMWPTSNIGVRGK